MAVPAQSTIPSDLQSLQASLPGPSPKDRNLIERAFYKAREAHDGQFRKSGEPFFTHCVAVARILAGMKLDAETIAAALLHDIVEDSPVTLDELRQEFGATVAMLVEGVTKLKTLSIEVNGKARTRKVDYEKEYIRRMLLTMGDDVRVVLIKLADRLHNMRTLGYMPLEKQKQIAQETMDIFAPLANRLGIWQFKWELEDLSFRYLEPEIYKNIARKFDEDRANREAYITNIIDTLRKALAENGIRNATITGRPKHLYSIYQKMQRKQVPFEEIYDTRAVRVIVDTVPLCYMVLGVVHNLWRPILQEFDDYIAAPKDNFYQSLHTAVIDSSGKTLEVQIRTWEMNENSEYGIAAYWRYKEGRQRDSDKEFEKRLTYLRRLMEFGPEVQDDPDAFIDTMKTEVFQDRVYVFTPKGDIVDLPAGSTPIDFAYYIHTDIGHRCRGAKIHGHLVSLNYRLKTGDQVEILTSNRGGPSMDWLNPDSGYVKTDRARTKIRHWLRKQDRDRHIAFGREVLERELKRLGVLDNMSFEAVAQMFNYNKLDDFMAAVGAGDINGAQITGKVLENERQAKKEEEASLLKPRVNASRTSIDSANGITILGTGGLLVNLARCCSPMPGDEIVGYITRGRGVTVHRRDCANMKTINDPERLIDVSWGGTAKERRYSVPVEVIAYDRDGLMRDIVNVIAEEQINLSAASVSTRQNIATFMMTMEIEDNRQLTRILSKIEGVRSVVEARRCNMS
jgi:RelA/SpoT family (p)ppGpp synthetase